jgi:Universal stress protein family
VTVAVVDKYGEVLSYEHFNKLIPPRKPKERTGMPASEEEEMRRKK